MKRFLLFALPFLAACSTRDVQITTKPLAAEIYVDGERIGPAPIVHVLDFGKSPRRTVVATAPGHFKVERIVSKEELPRLERGEIELVLPEDPSFNATTRCDAANTWVRIAASTIQSPETIWQRLVDGLTDRYASLEQLDDGSGYVRTSPLVRRFRAPAGEFRIRTRFLAAIAQQSPLVYKVRIECERADKDDDWQPWPRVFVEDARLLDELRARLGSNGTKQAGFPRVQPGSEPERRPAPKQPAFCDDCGAPKPADARFCPGCGTKLREGALR